jgi:hypothetical protein
LAGSVDVDWRVGATRLAQFLIAHGVDVVGDWMMGLLDGEDFCDKR